VKVRLGHGSEERQMSDSETKLEAYTLDLARYTKWLMVATVASSAAGVLSMVCTGWIAWYTRDLRDFASQQARDTAGALALTRDSVAAANRQAVAAEAANLAVTATAEKQLRAYLTIERHDTMDALVKDGKVLPAGPMHMNVVFRNVGQTPAYKVTFYEREAMLPQRRSDPPLKAPSEYATQPDANDIPEAAIIGAGLTQGYGGAPANAYSDSELKAFREGREVYVYWGAVYYEDVFSRPRYVRFCRYFADGNLNAWFACQNHNDSN
jgi:hypothetical protein